MLEHAKASEKVKAFINATRLRKLKAKQEALNLGKCKDKLNQNSKRTVVALEPGITMDEVIMVQINKLFELVVRITYVENEVVYNNKW